MFSAAEPTIEAEEAAPAQLDGDDSTEIIFWGADFLGVLDFDVMRAGQVAWMTAIERAPLPDGIGPWNFLRVGVGDIDGDHDVDIAVSFNGLTLFRNDGSLTFSPFVLTDPSDEFGASASLAVADLNGDGVAEILINNSAPGTARVAALFVGRNLELPLRSPTGFRGFAADPDVVDVNADGFLDVLGEFDVLSGHAGQDWSTDELRSASFLRGDFCTDTVLTGADSIAYYSQFPAPEYEQDGENCGVAEVLVRAAPSNPGDRFQLDGTLVTFRHPLLEIASPDEIGGCPSDEVFWADLNDDGMLDMVNAGAFSGVSVFYGEACE